MFPPARAPRRDETPGQCAQLDRRSFPRFSTMNFKFGYTDYKHLEIDEQEVGSTFKTSGVDSRLELVYQPIGPFQGSLGGQFFYKDLSILGADAFLSPPPRSPGRRFFSKR